MKSRLLVLLAGLAALLACSSCIESNQTLKLKKDGSGTIEEETIMGAQMVAMMAGFAGAEGGPDPFAEMYEEGQYKAKAKSYGEGVEYVKLEKIEKNGGKGVKVIYKFKDINTVKFEPGSGLDDAGPGGAPGEVGGAAEESQPLKFTYKGGKLTITFPDIPEDAKPEGAEDALPDENDPQVQQMMQMFKDMKVSAKLVVESGIASTNASYHEGNAITLMEVEFGKVLENPDGMKVLQKLDMEDRKAMEKALKGVKGVKFETKKTIEVKLK